MGRYIRWQAILTLTGMAMTLAFLSFLALSRTTVSIPDVGGVYTEAIAGTPRFINPLLAQYNQVDQDLSALIFNGLTTVDGAGNVEPDLARSWQTSDDGLVYVFRLRRDVRWQDGEPFTADDVLFTLRLIQDPEFPGVPYLNQFWQTVIVEKLDDYTIRFILPEPYPAFPEFTVVGILPEHLLQDTPARDLLNHPFNARPVGTGPFRLDRVNSREARFSINPLYYHTKSRLAGLTFQFYPNYQQTITAFRAGEVQGIGHIPPQAIPAVRNLDSLNLYTARVSGYDIIYLNLQNPDQLPFFQDAAVRQALLQALDRQAIIDEAVNGQGLVASGPILPWNWAYNPEQETVEFDARAAGQLLEEANWIDTDGDGIRDKDGTALAFTLLSSEEPVRVQVAQAVSKQWQRVGISTTVEVIGAGLGERLISHNFEAAVAEVLLPGDPDPFPLWHQSQIEGGQNYAGWRDTNASRLLEAARMETDRGRRNDYYFEFQRIFAEQVPSLILYYPVYTYGVSSELSGVQIAPITNPSDRFKTIADWYMLTRQVIYNESQFQEAKP